MTASAGAESRLQRRLALGYPTAARICGSPIRQSQNHSGVSAQGVLQKGVMVLENRQTRSAVHLLIMCIVWHANRMYVAGRTVLDGQENTDCEIVDKPSKKVGFIFVFGLHKTYCCM